MASQSPPPLPADAEVVRNIEVLAAFVAKTGSQFEQLARVNTAGDPKFGFLLGDSPPGSEEALSHAFYQWKKQRLEQRVFATDGSDDLQRKICAMVDDARTPPKLGRVLEVPNEVKPPSPGAAETETNVGALQKVEPSKSINSNSDLKPDHPLVHRAKGAKKPPYSTVHPKRKAESITASSITTKGMPHEDQMLPQSLFQEAKDKQALSCAESEKAALSAASQEQNRRASLLVQGSRDTSITGDPNKRKMVIAERALKAKISWEDSRNSPSDEARAAVDVSAEQQLAEATEKLSKESLGLKLLKSALADYVKEELKPAWKEGNMSKEAFKSIVKKVIDKVVGSLQAHQIPKSQENVDQYMAQSEAKISKLVQGYVDRFKKS